MSRHSDSSTRSQDTDYRVVDRVFVESGRTGSVGRTGAWFGRRSGRKQETQPVAKGG